MNNLDKTYTTLLQDILDNGVEKKDRTGTGTISVFGRQIRHKMSEGFPLLTTKKMAWKTMVTELLWFLRGDTNIKYLVDNDCHIWDGDCFQAYINKIKLQNKWEVTLRTMDVDTIGQQELLSKEEFINKIKTDDEFAKKWGELGPIYGKQWRSWTNDNFHKYVNSYDRKTNEPQIEHKVKQIDQIINLINNLKTNPDSRRLMVNAWNVGELDQMVLPPCHYGFQVYTRELTWEEQVQWVMKNTDVEWENLYIVEEITKETTPRRAISLMWNQRSVDTFLGLPFNIASYGLLLMMIADEVNMMPDELIGNLGDVHLYSNHIEQAKEQIGRELSLNERIDLFKKQQNLSEDVTVTFNVDYNSGAHLILEHEYNIPKRTREPYPLPTVHVRDGIFCSSVNDIILENYQSHPTIKAPLSN
jgi:thymidylate synthase